MRTLGEIEKQVVSHIIEYSHSEEGLENNVINILEQILSEDKERLRYNLKKEKIWVKKKYQDSETNSTNSIIENVVPIAQIIFCIDYLKEMNLISLIEYYYEDELYDTSQIDMSNRKDYQEIKDSKIKNFIFDNLRSGIFDTQHLIDYKKNDYRTVEQIQHEEQIRTMNTQIILAVVAVAVAIITIIVSCFFTFFSNCNK